LDGPGNSDQWDLAHALVGDQGYVTVVFANISKAITEADSDSIKTIEGVYTRNMIAVVRMSPPNDNRHVRNDADDNTFLSYTQLAAKYRLTVEALLPKVTAGWPIYFQIGNEPNLGPEWLCHASDLVQNPNADAGYIYYTQVAHEYAAFLRDVAAALHAIGDPRVKVMNAGISPGGWEDWKCDDEWVNSGVVLAPEFISEMKVGVPNIVDSLDAFAAHTYPGTQLGMADQPAYVDSIPSLSYFHQQLTALGKDLPVVITETGWSIDGGGHGWDRNGIATQTMAAWNGVWLSDPLIMAVTPFMLTGQGGWGFEWWWVDTDFSPFPVYTQTKQLRCAKGFGPCP